MNAVWAAAIQPAPLKFVAIALADCAGNDDGSDIYPSLQTIADMCGLSRAQARRHVNALVSAGLLLVEKPATQHRPPRYRMVLSALQGLHQRHPCEAPGVAPMQLRGSTHATQGLHPRTPGVASTVPEPKGTQGNPREPSPPGERRSVPPAVAGAETPPIGDPALWAKLRRLRKGEDQAQWVLEAEEFYPAGGPALDQALEQLIANPHWKYLPGPGRSAASSMRTPLAGMDYSKGLT